MQTCKQLALFFPVEKMKRTRHGVEDFVGKVRI